MVPRWEVIVMTQQERLKRIERTVDGIIADYHLVQQDRHEIQVGPIPSQVVNGLFYIASQAQGEEQDKMVPHSLCDNCSTGVANDDWTHLDYYYAPQQANEEHTKILATLEELGWLSHSHTSEESGYFNCAVCNDIQCGNPNIWEAKP